MSDTLEVAPQESAPPQRLSPAQLAVVSAREKLSRYVNRSVEILEELAETAENERVRLAAVESILDRAGVGKTSTTHVVEHSQAEHDAADAVAREVVESLARNKRHVNEGPAPKDLETLIVHEGDA